MICHKFTGKDNKGAMKVMKSDSNVENILMKHGNIKESFGIN